jgi:hypothetical protein
MVEFACTVAVPVPVANGFGVTTVVGVDAVVEEAEALDADESMPLQKPPTQVLKAHWELLEHAAWKLPQVGICIEFTA